MKERENILKILIKTNEAIKKQDVIILKNLSNQTIHTASISQDSDNIVIAVIVYSISKIIERKEDYSTKPGWDRFYDKITMQIKLIIDSLKKNDKEHIIEHLSKLRKTIEGVSGTLKKYIQDVFIKAKINKASRIYEHGISLEKTAKLLGITQWDLASYSGQTGISDVKLGKTMDIKSRINLAMEIFK